MRLREVRVLLLYPPNQSLPGTMCKPNGSLAYPSLAGSLREHGVDVRIYDACVGGGSDDVEKIFFKSVSELPTGLLRTGVPSERILAEVESYDLVGLTSIFTDQETMVLNTARLIRDHFPEKILVAGGVNARARLRQFFSSGFDLVCLSEAEKTVLDIVDVMRQSSCPDFSKISGIAYRADESFHVNPTEPRDVVTDLDQLPMPAWDLLPNERYWKIARPHGGFFPPGTELRYASIMTSLGCPFHCTYCHIAGEKAGSLAGEIGAFRIKSDERVLRELDALKGLGIKQLFIEDDALFGKKKRSLALLEKIQGAGFDILDLQGVNIVHLLKRWQPDIDVIEALVNAGFKELVLPFESGNQRILRKYASNKLNITQSNIEELIRVCKSYGLRIGGNYMLGYPDETYEEVQTTIDLARQHMSWGLDQANFFLVMPLPGTPLFDMACAEGYLSPDFNADTMNWVRANMVDTPVSPADLERIRDEAWEELNPQEFRQYKKTMIARLPHSESAATSVATGTAD